MKILYLIMLYNGEINGGHTYRMATAKAIRDIVGHENLDLVISDKDVSDWQCNIVKRLTGYTDMKQKIRNLMQGNITQISNNDINDIISLINKNKYELVIFGSSETGKLLRKIKKHCNVKTVTFYHDIIADVIGKKKKTSFDIKMLPVWQTELRAEKSDAKLTDCIVALHKRDDELLKKYYGRKADMHMPIILEDKAKKRDGGRTNNNQTMHLLFVGAYTWSVNVEALRWFCDNVMVQLSNYDIELDIVGFKMEELKNDTWVSRFNNLNIIGTVDDIEPIYTVADLVVLPIIKGSGMKVKTAEALMFGKELIGTTEALVGYDELKSNICDEADEFVQKILYYYKERPNRFVEQNRQYYEREFSMQSFERRFKEMLSRIE